MQLTRHSYADGAARYYIDARRVSREEFYTRTLIEEGRGAEYACLVTQRRRTRRGAHWVHHSCLSKLGGALRSHPQHHYPPLRIGQAPSDERMRGEGKG